jgi:hypothetical protein
MTVQSHWLEATLTVLARLPMIGGALLRFGDRSRKKMFPLPPLTKMTALVAMMRSRERITMLLHTGWSFSPAIALTV